MKAIIGSGAISGGSKGPSGSGWKSDASTEMVCPLPPDAVVILACGKLRGSI